MLTSFPDFRQKYMKTINAFFIRLRTVHGKDIKRYNPELEVTNKELADKLWAPL